MYIHRCVICGDIRPIILFTVGSLHKYIIHVGRQSIECWALGYSLANIMNVLIAVSEDFELMGMHGFVVHTHYLFGQLVNLILSREINLWGCACYYYSSMHLIC